MDTMTEPTSPRTSAKTKASKGPTAASRDHRSTLKSLGDVPGALVGMLRETRLGTEHVVDAISDAPDAYKAEVRASLDAVREQRRDPGLDLEEKRLLEGREDELLDRLHHASRESVDDIRGAHQDFAKVAVLGAAGVALLGAAALGNKEMTAGILKAVEKVTTRAITT